MMQAVVLVGGEGTRLRPLTETVPKPLLPVANRPFLHRVLDHLADHGVHEVVLSSPYLEETFGPFIDERHGDPKITWITESYPLGTGGAIVNAMPHLDPEPFLVLNGDILTDLDLSALVDFHLAHRAVATITLSPVEDARPFGLVATEPGGRVLEFREKPVELVPGDVAGRPPRIDPRPPQRLVGEQVADAGHRGLVQQAGLDRRAPAPDALREGHAADRRRVRADAAEVRLEPDAPEAALVAQRDAAAVLEGQREAVPPARVAALGGVPGVAGLGVVDDDAPGHAQVDA